MTSYITVGTIMLIIVRSSGGSLKQDWPTSDTGAYVPD